jgi:hypothetical protein
MTLSGWAGLILLAGFFGIVFWKLLTGGMVLGNLLEGDVRDPAGARGFSSQVSAGRVQSLMMTLFTALYYLLQVIHNPTRFPKLPNGLVGALAGSQAVYLAGKAQAMLRGRWRDILK